MRRTGRARTVRADVVRAVIAQCSEDDRRWSLQELQANIGNYVQNLREDLHIRKISAKWVPHALTEQQNGVAMKLIFIWKGIKMKKRTC